MHPFQTVTLTLATLGLFAGTTAAQAPAAPYRTLILLQENSGASAFTDWMPAAIRTPVDAIIDTAIETTEAARFQALATGRYQRFVNLSDTNCTRTNLLNNLIAESNAGHIVDLAVLGHGSDNVLSLHGETLTGGTAGNLRSMLTQARTSQGAAFTFKLRLVHMCNCYGSTLNDDWLAIGAKTSIGSINNDYVPEPMIGFFWDDFVKNDKRAGQAALDSWNAACPFFYLVPTYYDVNAATGRNKFDESRPVVAGNTNLIFRDQYQMAVGQTRTFTVQANQAYNWAPTYMLSGQVYTFTATGTWRNGNTVFSPAATNANGYTPGVLDGARRNSANMMRLIGERFAKLNSTGSFVGGSGFSIGTSRQVTAAGPGFLVLYANDMLAAYGDNIGSVTVTIRRDQ